MATHGETRNQTSSMPGRKPSFSRSIGQSLSAAFGKKDGYYFEIEFLSDTASYHVGEKKQILVDYVEIGRSSSCVVRYRDEGIEGKVSGKHISISRNGGEWTLEHLSKTNSTIVNGGSRIIRPEDSFKKYVLQDGDTIQLAKGGPVIRFVVPRENSMQSLRSKSRGSTFVRNVVSQAIAPYKKTIRTLLGIIIALAILWAAYAIYEHKHHEKVIAALQEELDRIRESGSEEVTQLQQKIEEQESRIANQERSRLQTVTTPRNVPGIDEMMRNQNLAADVFFIIGKSVVVIDGEEIPVSSWGATGFLLNDGRFVTARHCVEAWLFPDNDTVLSYSIAAESRSNIKMKAYINAFSTNSGRRLSFTSDQFHIDRSKDRIKVLDNYEDGTPKKFRCVFPMDHIFQDEEWDKTMYATDWAWVQTQITGSLEIDATLSNNLISQQQLLVMGFPQGLGVETERIEPISYQMNVTQSGLSENGCIMHSIGTDHGNSGGPIFAVKDGKLVVVGIVSRGDSRTSQNGIRHSLYNWAVPISRIGNR